MAPRLLIVDDHAAFREVAAALLTADGFTVVGEAADGRGAVTAVRALRPDVVLLDVQLADADGFAVAELLAAQAHPPVVVLVSGRSRSDYGRRVARSAADGYLPKAELSGDALRRLLPGAPPPAS
jgi:DNA-binding NarL/FixJ family response regulator